MNQQRQDYQTPYHITHIKKLFISLLKQPGPKYQSIILTKRTAQIVYSFLTESEIYSCGFKKIILSTSINAYMSYEDVVLVFTVSGEEDYEEISQFSRKVDKVYLLNLGLCTQQSKLLLKKLEFTQKDSIRGYRQQNLDFYCYLHNTFILTTRKQKKDKKKQNDKAKPERSISLDTAVDRLSSFLFSYQSFSEFQFYLPKKSEKLSQKIKEIMETKLKILSKYDYKALSKNQGMSAIKTRVIVLERTEQISPFILSLYYGPIVEQLNISRDCRFVSSHSTIYNSLYHLDLLSAGTQITQMISDLSQNKNKQLSTVDLKQAKKFLQKAYNPNQSKQQLQFHYKLLAQVNSFMEGNCQLLVLQQSIANKINEVGEKMKGSRIVKEIYQWCKQEKNVHKYQRYMGLLVQALTVHDYWWYQKNQLLMGLSDKNDIQAIQQYIKKRSIHNLKQKPPKKDENGVEIRQKCFRHHPTIIDQFQKVSNQIKEKKLETCQLLKISQQEVSLAKKSRTLVYIDSVIGYNELAMLIALKKPDIEFVCREVKTTKEWTDHLLFSS